MSIYDYEVKTIDDKIIKLDRYKGKVLLIINSALDCVFSSQYIGLEQLYEEYNKLGFEILDFPCAQFSHQNFDDSKKINEECNKKYNTKFMRFSKIDVNGENESPLYKYLKKEQPKEEITGVKNRLLMKSIKKLSKTYQKKGDIKWNFTKFLINNKGHVVKRYSPVCKPQDMKEDILRMF